MQAEIRELTERVQSLERQNRNLKRYGIAGAALVGFIGLTSMATSMCKTVWAERFVLQDSGGRERGVITAYETGGAPTLSLLDSKGQKALSFGVSEDGRAYVELPSEKGAVRSNFTVSAEGHATIEKGKDVAAAR